MAIFTLSANFGSSYSNSDTISLSASSGTIQPTSTTKGALAGGITVVCDSGVTITATITSGTCTSTSAQITAGSGGATPTRPWRCTMGMQETVAMALAHSLSCGLALIDDEALASVRKTVEASVVDLAVAHDEDGDESPPAISPEGFAMQPCWGIWCVLPTKGS